MRSLASTTALVLSVLIALATTATGCGAPTRPAPGTVVTRARLTTDGVTLRAGPWSIHGGEAGRLPAVRAAAYTERPCRGAVDAADAALARVAGAIDVEVIHPSSATPLRGVLLICEVPPTDRGPTSRSFELVVPADRIAETSGGRVSVVWELADAGGEQHAWILWLAESPP